MHDHGHEKWRQKPCGECAGCAGGTCDAYELPFVWRRWSQDNTPILSGFNLRHLWVRRRIDEKPYLLRVRWESRGGRLVAERFEPAPLRELFEMRRGWWAYVDEPQEPKP